MNVVVTGATRGIGKAITERFASEGANLAFCARTKRDLDELYENLHQKFPDAELIYLPCDLSEKGDVKDFADLIKSNWNSIDVLVNNAGIYLPGEVYKEKPGTLEKLMKANLYSAYYLTKYLVKMMIQEKRGHIFNLCSVASLGAYRNGGSYSISKFALLGLSKNLRMELIPHNIRVTAVIAGATLTSSWENSGLPDERFIKSDDVATAIWNAYALSPQTVIEELLIRPMQGDIK